MNIQDELEIEKDIKESELLKIMNKNKQQPVQPVKIIPVQPDVPQVQINRNLNFIFFINFI